ncbi:MAG TPA: thermonuclease family protein [Thermoguttaceae bacterium]|nr:thermonuclease family protein [Thermoguttaceae bacterium]HPP52207.1 thermonuclease family protein [Thermoguttaceae bacterium]
MRRPKSLAGVVLLVILLLWVGWQRIGRQGPSESPPTPHSSFAELKRVIDGDTFELSDGVRVRLIGVDAPELGRAGQSPEPFSREATLFAENFLASGPVRLEDDPYERQDRYGRRLAYVWVGQRMLNEELVRAGLARHRPEFNYLEERKWRFALAEQEARQARRGLWASQPP